jgi:isocitrate dehydrogenase (NAD+)
MSQTVVLIPGDGIGPEVTEATRRVVDAAGAGIRWVERHAGVTAIERGADTVLPRETVTEIQEHGVALKGPCATPIGGGFSSVNVALRKRLNLYGAVRPVRSIEGVETRYEGVDLVVVRENTEGLYSGIENIITEGVITSLKVATRKACIRIAEFAFDYARRNGRKRVTAFHKANIMKLSDGLFIDCAREIHEASYPDIIYDERIIDAACMRLVQEPKDFDVLLCENLYGDVISDLCAGFVGGLGVTPGSNYGDGVAVFEAVHGTAPDIAGQNLANPLAMFMSAEMMLDHLATTREDEDCKQASARLKSAWQTCMKTGERTRDLGGELGTREFADAVIARLG